MTTSAHLLNSRRFFPFFMTQFLQVLNDTTLKNAVIILATYKIMKGAAHAPWMVTLATGTFILPFFIFSAWAGQFADKFEKSGLIRIIKISEISIIVFSVFGFYSHSIFLLLVSLFLMGTHSAFFSAIKYSILPDHLQPQELISGNAYVEASTFIAILMGSLLGGILISLTHGESITSFVLLSISLVGLGICLFIPKTFPAQPDLKINFKIIPESKRIMEYATRRRDVFLCILGISWFWLVGTVLLAQFPSLCKEILGADSGVASFFIGIFSIGVAVGSLVCQRLLKEEVNPKYVPLGVLGISVCCLDLYFACFHTLSTPSHLLSVTEFLMYLPHWRIIADLLVLATCGGLFVVPLYAIMQMRAKPQHRSRTIAGNNLINSFAMVLSSVFTLVLLTLHFSIPQIILTIGLANALVAIYICKLLPHVLLQEFARWLFKTCFRVKVIGMQHYRDAGKKVIVIANHTSFLDVALLAAFLPDKFIFAVNPQVAQSWWLHLFLVLVDVVTVDPADPFSARALVKEIRANRKCIIFPEGRVSLTGSLMKIYEGSGFIADQSGAMVLPIRIKGAQYTPFARLRGKVKMKIFPRITLTILPPRSFDISQTVQERARRRLISQQLHDVMTHMMFSSSDYQQCVFDSLLESKKIHGGKRVILEDTEHKPITFNQLISRSFIWGRYLSHFCELHEFVGLLLPHNVKSLSVFFALQAFHRIPAILESHRSSDEIVFACKIARIKNLITSRKLIENHKFKQVIDALSILKINVHFIEDFSSQISMFNYLMGYGDSLISSFYKRNSTLRSHQEAAVVLFDSEGQGVVLSHENIQSNRYQLLALVDFNVRDVVVNAMPFSNAFGLISATLTPLLGGVKTILYPSSSHYRIYSEFVYEHSATITFGTNQFLAGCGNVANPYDFYNIRYVFCIDPLAESTRQIWSDKFGIRILGALGTSDISLMIATNTPMHNKAGSSGRFLPGIQYQIREGRLFIKGFILSRLEFSTREDWNSSEDNGIFEDGWYDTQTFVEMDAQGFVYRTANYLSSSSQIPLARQRRERVAAEQPGEGA